MQYILYSIFYSIGALRSFKGQKIVEKDIRQALLPGKFAGDISTAKTY